LNHKWARDVAAKCINAIGQDDKQAFWQVLNPVLDAKVSFPLLDEIGKQLGQAGKLGKRRYFAVFDSIIETEKMGGYVIVGQGLAQFFDADLEASVLKAKEAIIKGKTWYVCDILGERVFGQALVDCFDGALDVLEEMVAEENQAVRRSLGVSVHFFTKRKPNNVENLRELFVHLLLPLVEDKRVFVVKGTGWGLKTIGRYQPKLGLEFLEEILATKTVSKLMVRKATKYLDTQIKDKMIRLWELGIQKNKSEKH
jgi:3-methyladenine DNA glycosylase AlkD